MAKQKETATVMVRVPATLKERLKKIAGRRHRAALDGNPMVHLIPDDCLVLWRVVEYLVSCWEGRARRHQHRMTHRRAARASARLDTTLSPCGG